VHRGRSAWWYRRQVFATILGGLTADVAAHKLLAVQQMRMTLFSRWGSALWGESEVLRQLWVYYNLPFVLVMCVIFMAIGWTVATLHRRHLPAIVIVFSATLLIPATFQAMEIRRLLETDLWPGWGWGSFRWALIYQALLSFVAYPLCVLIGGLWSLPTDDGHELPGNSGAVVDEA